MLLCFGGEKRRQIRLGRFMLRRLWASTILRNEADWKNCSN